MKQIGENWGYWLFGSLTLLALVFALFIFRDDSQIGSTVDQNDTRATESNDSAEPKEPSPPKEKEPEVKEDDVTIIEPSPPEASSYVAQAIEMAKLGSYRAAANIIAEAMELFPDDQNLSLTYQNYVWQAERHGQ